MRKLKSLIILSHKIQGIPWNLRWSAGKAQKGLFCGDILSIMGQVGQKLSGAYKRRYQDRVMGPVVPDSLDSSWIIIGVHMVRFRSEFVIPEGNHR